MIYKRSLKLSGTAKELQANITTRNCLFSDGHLRQKTTGILTEIENTSLGTGIDGKIG